ncbi:hypothetical protein [Chryseobacterium sp. MP_3.2]|uniref:hypothetical protein n=1 Tax=Chryseobacterium sp. MP_3.2 TaxID=3071712 RepID=UPI002E156B6E
MENLSKITTKEELLAKQELFAELTDRIAFLKILEKNKEAYEDEESVFEDGVNHQHISENQSKNGGVADFNQPEERVEEEVMFTNEINDIEDQLDNDILDEIPQTVEPETSSNLESINVEGEDLISKELTFEIDNERPEEFEQPKNSDLEEYEERIAKKEQEFLELEERRRKIVEFSKSEPISDPSEEAVGETPNSSPAVERKFKLANIKGLKAMRSMFEDDPLEKIEEEEALEKKEIDAGSLLKTNISTEFMEAVKKKPEFRLDFNDKIAFTKLLFNGDEADLKQTIEQLNSYENIEDARTYLSELYYKKEWNKVDEYAQRLWNLVENKFL